MGAGFRMIADLSDPEGGLWAIDAGSESGHPGSPHYNDQIGDWLTARYHHLPLKTGEPAFESELVLTPKEKN
jgi:penicillin amidase